MFRFRETTTALVTTVLEPQTRTATIILTSKTELADLLYQLTNLEYFLGMAPTTIPIRMEVLTTTMERVARPTPLHLDRPRNRKIFEGLHHEFCRQ